MRNSKIFAALFIAVFLGGCAISNPLSELSWGEATVVGRVTRTATLSGNTVVDCTPGAIVKTDSGTEQTHTNEEGYYSLTLKFRIGSAAKEKKIKITAYDINNGGKTASIADVYIRDGLTVEAPPITWAK